MKINPFRLERFFDKYEFKVKYVLCSSDCESLAVEDLLALEPDVSAQLNKLWLGYTEYAGSPALRLAISGLYERVEPDQVVVHTGAEEAIYTFMNAVLSPGDHIIVHFPGYQSLSEVAAANGCEVTHWTTREEEGWELDLDFLRRNIRPNTRAIVVNCPHNPTGYLMDASKQRELVEIAREHNLLLFSDEVYRELEYNRADRLPAACDLYENAVSLGVMSKTYGLAGLRIGWAASRNGQVLAKMVAFKDYLSMCNSAPSEFLATLALHHREKLAARNLEIIGQNLPILDRFFVRHRTIFNWQRPIAGTIAFPSLKTGQPVEEFCLELVDQTGVLLIPGTLFDFGNRHFRIGFARRNMPEALAKLEEYLAART
ncbi:MAG: Aspartate transaminase [Chloroflexi bacterium]|nr:Aspartate transaminase [Chloroflexota bacterium]